MSNLFQNDAIRSEQIVAAFRAVDRGAFVPVAERDTDRQCVYNDRPFGHVLDERDGSALHMSAPDMYASSLESLEMAQSSGLSFLNIGSGSGYLSSIVSILVGPQGSVHGVEIWPNVVTWSQERFAEFSRTVTPGTIARDVRFVCGNALNIDH